MKFPDFKDARFGWFTACGEITIADKDKELMNWLKNEPSCSAPFKTAHGTGYIRAIFGGSSEKHLHFDVFSPQLVTKAIKAKKISLSEFNKKLERVSGMEIVTHIKGVFRVAVTELPEKGMIRSLSFQANDSNVSIKLNGATFAIKGAPIQTMSWREAPSGFIYVELESESNKTVLDESYLLNFSTLLEQSFNVFALEAAPK